jgi:hypothetical protein
MLIDRRQHSSVLDLRSFRAANCDTDHYLLASKVRERLAVRNQTMHRFHIGRFNLDNMKDSLYKELIRVFDTFPKYHREILLGDFVAKGGKEDIFRLIIRNKSFHEISNDNEVQVVNFATSKNLTVKNTMFPRCNINKFIGYILVERLTIKLTIF